MLTDFNNSSEQLDTNARLRSGLGKKAGFNPVRVRYTQPERQEVSNKREAKIKVEKTN